MFEAIDVLTTIVETQAQIIRNLASRLAQIEAENKKAQ